MVCCKTYLYTVTLSDVDDLFVSSILAAEAASAYPLLPPCNPDYFFNGYLHPSAGFPLAHLQAGIVMLSHRVETNMAHYSPYFYNIL